MKPFAAVEGQSARIRLKRPKRDFGFNRLDLVQKRPANAPAPRISRDVQRLNPPPLPRQETQRIRSASGHPYCMAVQQPRDEALVLTARMKNRHPVRFPNPVPDDPRESDHIPPLGIGQSEASHNWSPIRNSTARSSRICGGPSPGFRVSRAGAKVMRL